MPRKPADRYHHGDLRRALVDGALRLLRRTAPDRLSLRAVARLAGVSPNAPYRHFPDKDALLASVAEEGFRRLRAACEACVGAPELRLAAMGTAYLGFARQHPNVYRLMFGPHLRGWEAHPGLVAAADAAFGTLVDAIAAAHRLDRDAATTAAVVIWSTVHGYATLEFDGGLHCCAAHLLPTPEQLGRLPNLAPAARVSAASSRRGSSASVRRGSRYGP